jgi:hypothetical protein
MSRAAPSWARSSRRTAEVSLAEKKKNLWWTNWVYRCAKISLTDIQQLEPYTPSIEQMQNYFRDGEETVYIASLNSKILPKEMRYLVRVFQEDKSKSLGATVYGIGNLYSLCQGR